MLRSEAVAVADEREFASREAARPSLWWIASALLRARRLILASVATGVVLALAVVMLRRPQYSTTFSFVPQSATDPSKSGLASIAGQFGVSLGAAAGQGQSPQFYADLLTTREILLPIASDSFAPSVGAARRTLAELYNVDGESPAVVLDKMLLELRDKMVESSVATRTTGVITVRVRALTADVSLAIASRLLAGINQFNLLTRQSQAAAERRFVEGRVAAGRSTLRSSEEALQRFLSSNRQIANSPQLAFDRDRLEREVSLQQQLVSGLIQQFEDARIKEVRDTPVITVIEKPRAASRADSRNGIVTLASGAALGLLIAVSWVLGRAGTQRLFSAPSDSDMAAVASWWRRSPAAR